MQKQLGLLEKQQIRSGREQRSSFTIRWGTSGEMRLCVQLRLEFHIRAQDRKNDGSAQSISF